MKSEERHELKSNELEKLTARLRPIFEQYGLQIVLAVSGVVAIAAAIMFWNRTSSAEKTAGWTELNNATSAEKMLEVAEAEALSKKPVAAWARLQAAERYLENGIRQSLENREGERGLVSDLDEARENFKRVLAFAAVKSELKERALYGLGRCLETMAGVNQRTDSENSTTADLLDEAARAYRQLLDEFPNSAYNQKRYAEEALGNLERHLQFLKTEEAREFYAWFRTQNPKPEDRRSPFDSMPSGHPPIDSGPVTLPPIPEGLRLLDDDTEADTQTGPAFPAAPQKLPADETDGSAPATKPPAAADGGDKKPAKPKAQPDKTNGP